MSTEESLSAKIKNSREAVRAHMECGMPQRREQWAAELKRRRNLRKATPKPPPQEPAAAALGIEKSLLDASARDFAWEPEKKRKARATEEEGIESYWVGGG